MHSRPQFDGARPPQQQRTFRSARQYGPAQITYEQAFAMLEPAYPTSIEMQLMNDKAREQMSAFPISVTNGKKLDHDIAAKFGSYRGIACATCQGKSCLGHLGLMHYPKVPVVRLTGGIEYQPMRVINPACANFVKQIVKVLCLSCHRITRANEPGFAASVLSLPRNKRLERLVRECEGKACNCTNLYPHQGENLVCSVKYNLKSIDGARVKITESAAYVKKVKGEEVIQPVDVDWSIQNLYEVFSNIGGSLEENLDKQLTGFSPDELQGFFPNSLLVIGPRYRPTTDKNKSHKLTVAYDKIYGAIGVYDAIVASQKSPEDKQQAAQTLVNEVSKNLTDFHVELEAMTSKKQGIVRKRINAKRPGTNGRLTIVPSDTVNFGEFEVPEELVKRALFRATVVREENREHFQQLYYQGKVHAVVPASAHNTDRPIDVAEDNLSNKAHIVLRIGDLVYYELDDSASAPKGRDSLVTGRQPTQNQYNVLAAFIKIVRKKGIFACSPHFEYMSKKIFAGDFDGDQTWLAAVQSEEAMDDLLHMHITRWMRTHQSGDSAIGLAYNSVIAAMILSLMDDYWVLPRLSEPELQYTDDMVVAQFGDPEFVRAGAQRTQLSEDNFRATAEYRRYAALLRAHYVPGDYEYDQDIRLAEFSRYDPQDLGPAPFGYDYYPSISRALWEHCVEPYSTHPRMASFDRRLAKHGVAKYSGRGLLSSLFPEDFNYRRDDDENPVVILDGILVQGLLTGGLLGSDSGSILDRMTIYYEDDEQSLDPATRRPGGRKNTEAANYVNDGTRMFSRFIEGYGFTVSYQELIMYNTKELEQEVNRQIETSITQIMQLEHDAAQYDQSQYERHYQEIVNETQGMVYDLEVRQNKQYQTAIEVYRSLTPEQRSETPEPQAPLPLTIGSYKLDQAAYITRLREGQVMPSDEFARFITNGYQMLVKSGTKGKEGNINSMAYIMGLQKMSGGLLPQTVSEGRRLTVMNRADSWMPQDKGMIFSSLRQGLTLTEMMFSSMADREGMISTTTTSPIIGYGQNLSHRALASVVSVDGGAMITTMTHSILQYVYGGDGLDGMFVRSQDVGYGKAYVPHDLQGQTLRLNSAADLVASVAAAVAVVAVGGV
jgi:DNA-directed RNA polymerase beta' subunit